MATVQDKPGKTAPLSSLLVPVYKGNGDPVVCGSYRGIKLLEHAMKVVKSF